MFDLHSGTEYLPQTLLVCLSFLLTRQVVILQHVSCRPSSCWVPLCKLRTEALSGALT